MTRSAAAFLSLVLVQACHSVEEFVFRLWEVLAPARYVSGALGLEPAIGFAVANVGLFLFGAWCWLGPVRGGRPSGRALMWGWGLVETANGCAHLALAAAANGYFPGLYTAPLLIVAGLWLVRSLVRDQADTASRA
ncbi:MAG: HXXEE domain-containing protein [Alphaproteobacteria bacterium]|nr:HXXEE domain-containing protein [Alphaproteobacteria bacterium]MBV9373253.1 HXXEE domain-containing protein [Alphaproteobacteria bacterium]MBV9901219.1 HXXEE domain-containing protein [Alphaproteobacteria bacterium]